MSILKTIYLQHLNGANANMTLDSNGYVGVGTTSPNRPLEVAGAWRLGTDSGAYAGGLGGGFNVSNNIYSMYFRDRTDTSWNDVFFEAKSLRLKVNNGADTGIYIDSSARVTMPYQPAFLVGIGSNTDATVAQNAYFPFNSAVFNRGNHFNTSTNRFTAPVSGVYFFSFNLYFTNSSGFTQGTQAAIFVNGSFVGVPSGDAYGLATCLPNSLGGTIEFATTVMLNLSSGDTVGVAARTANGTRVYQGHTNFMGYLIG